MIFGTCNCKLHTTRSDVMQILSKFCQIKHLKSLYDNLYSRVILPITMHRCVVIQQCYFYKKTGSYSQKNIIINSKANKYQQNYKQAILP